MHAKVHRPHTLETTFLEAYVFHPNYRPLFKCLRGGKKESNHWLKTWQHVGKGEWQPPEDGGNASRNEKAVILLEFPGCRIPWCFFPQ